MPLLWFLHLLQVRTMTVEQQRDSLLTALRVLLEQLSEPPEANCSCHISAPCHDCVTWFGEREAFAIAKDSLAKVELAMVAPTSMEDIQDALCAALIRVSELQDQYDHAVNVYYGAQEE